MTRVGIVGLHESYRTTARFNYKLYESFLRIWLSELIGSRLLAPGATV